MASLRGFAKAKAAPVYEGKLPELPALERGSRADAAAPRDALASVEQVQRNGAPAKLVGAVASDDYSGVCSRSLFASTLGASEARKR